MNNVNIYDVAIIGGGPAGYTAAIKAAERGASVLIFEKDALGGTCLNRGCIPTKTLLKTAQLLESFKSAEARGINIDSHIELSMPKIIKHKDTVVKQLQDGVAYLLKSNKVQVVRGLAKLQSETQISCNDGIYQAKNIILCGGSKPAKLSIAGFEDKRIITSDEILGLTEIPKRLCIVGGGAIGCEMADIFSSFGSEVTIIELFDRLIPTMDSDLSESMQGNMENKGVKLILGAAVDELKRLKTGISVIIGNDTIDADTALISTGRVADLECLGELRNKIKTENDKIIVDDHMRTSISNIYAPGDINGKLMLAHAAYHMGEVAAINATGGLDKVNLSCVPSSVYTNPEVASVGLSEHEAKDIYGADNLLIGKASFKTNGRSLAYDHPVGYVKVIADKKYGEILGAHIVGQYASELIQEAVILISNEITIHEAVNTIYGHPTFSETFREACLNVQILSQLRCQLLC